MGETTKSVVLSKSSQRAVWPWRAALALVAPLCSIVGCELIVFPRGGEETCVVDGVKHKAGQGFIAADGCNSCSCSEDGDVSCTLLACTQACGGLSGAACGGDSYCKYELNAQCGAADQTGLCSAKPEACAEEYAPVCGCDGTTYGNACSAAAAGASVAALGECATEVECTSDEECPQPSCACLDENEDGQCENHCPTLGCRDGRCVDISPPQSTSCGGLLGLRCGPGEFCSFPMEASCGAGDQTGTCEALPQYCGDIYDPVCGCDQKTHSSPCEAAAAGVSVRAQGTCDGSCETRYDCPVTSCACEDANHDGTCDNSCPGYECTDGVCVPSAPTGDLQAGDACGGNAPPGSPTCAAWLFCQSQPGDLCGAADAPGLCVAVPSSCPDGGSPVCGCDGQTYPSACHASMAMAGMLDKGACPIE